MANTEKKMTYVEALDIVLAGKPITEEVRQKLEKMREGYVKKSTTPNAKTEAKRSANLAMGEMVLDFLASHPSERFTVTQLMKSVPGLPDEITNSKLTYILHMEGIVGRYTRTDEKGRAYFSVKV